MTTPVESPTVSLTLTDEEFTALTAAANAAKPRRKSLLEQLTGTPNKPSAPRVLRRGMRRKGQGGALWVEPPIEARGTSVQVCGLWPFAVGSSLPVVGVPLGHHLITGSTVCADPIMWYLNNLVNQPSMFVLGRPGLGKSSLTRRIATVLTAWGIMPMILGDLKPDYVDLMEELKGQVITVGRGHGHINPLDMGPLTVMLDQLPPDVRSVALEEMRGRRGATLTALVAMALHRSPHPMENNVLAVALRLVDETKAAAGDTTPAVISDVLAMIDSRPAMLSKFVQDGGDADEYLRRTRELVDALRVYDEDGPYGDLFAGQTTTVIELDRPLCFDLSSLESDESAGGGGLDAVTQLVCWSYGSSAISAAKTLAAAGLAPERHYFLVFDELWRILRAGDFMVEFIDALTRLNRQKGLGQAMITHTMNDLVMETEAATRKAWGFVERSALVFLGGLAASEMGNLNGVFSMSDAETNMITSWSDDGEVNPDTGRVASPPGQGNFLLKVGKKPGIPFHVDLTDTERHINDTNKRWSSLSAHVRGA